MGYKLNMFETSLSVSGLSYIHYFEFADNYETTNDSHEFCELLYVDRGAISVSSENYTGELSGGQMIIHKPREIHSLKCSAINVPNVIVIGFECDEKELEMFSYRAINLSSEHKKMLSEIMKEGMNVYEPPYDVPNTFEMKKRENYVYGADQMLKLRLEMFLISLVRMYQDADIHMDKVPFISVSRISEIHQHITEHYTEKISLDDICFLFGTNKTSLCRDFKNEYGTTILRYVNELRIKEAKALLRQSKLSVTEISEKLGFNSIHYFCKTFKKITRLSPKEYIKNIRSKFDSQQ